MTPATGENITVSSNGLYMVEGERNPGLRGIRPDGEQRAIAGERSRCRRCTQPFSLVTDMGDV